MRITSVIEVRGDDDVAVHRLSIANKVEFTIDYGDAMIQLTEERARHLWRVLGHKLEKEE